MIALKHIHAVRTGTQIFTDLSWTIKDGENWLITGPTGSGKTMLLEAVSGQLHITGGAIEIDFVKGNDWDERYQDRRRKIHLIPAHAIQTLMRQNQNQYYQQRYYDIGDERTPLVRDVLGESYQRLDRLSLPESFAVHGLLDLELTRLSNGQLKKILLLRILLTGIPRLLLLDYPFEGLDVASRADLCRFIDFIYVQYGTQIILSDHHHQLPDCLNRKLILNRGTIVSQSAIEPKAAVSRPVATERTSQSSTEPVVEIRNLMIRYNDTTILENFDWTIRKGERWALIGRNGAGKTTLFSMIFADHPMAYSQEIYLFGRRRGSGESIWDIKKRISYLGPELMSYLSAEQTIQTARQYLRTVAKPWNQTVFDQLLEALAAGSFIDKPMRTLSSGEVQMTLIISCLMKDAEILLLDEPFQFLDPVQQSNFRRYLKSHLNSDQTLILITHYEEDLREWTHHTKRL